MFSAIADGFGYLFGLLGKLGLWILEGIGKLLAPIFELIGAIFYFIYMLGVVLVKIILLVVGVGKLLLGVVAGLFMTIAGLSYSESAPVLPGSYQSAFDHLGGFIGGAQLDNVAYLLVFAIWLFTAFGAIRIIGAMRGGAG
jgi:hypothetical protein